MSWGKSFFTAALLLGIAGNANAAMRITEWMYDGSGGEFIELTNTSNAAIDMTGWSYDDDSRLPGEFDLSGFGVVQPGESVVLVELIDVSGVDFHTAWGLAPTVKVLGPYTNNLGRADEINIFDATNSLADRLTYGDNRNPLDPPGFIPTAGSIRTQNRSGNPSTFAAVGINDVFQWEFSSNGDAYGSTTSLWGDIGNPGYFALSAQVPEPTSVVLLLCGAVGVAMLRRRS